MLDVQRTMLLYAVQVMEVLVQLAAVKRPLFVPGERQDYFTRFARGMANVLSTQTGLANQECFHQVCI